MLLPPFNINDLINAKSVESMRIEYKSSWTEPIKKSVTKSICAFANDMLNLNGSYII